MTAHPYPARVAKRVIDIVGSGLALLVLAPVMVIVAVVVRVVLGSPVLFRQTRPGLGGAPFEIVKFRTMSDAVGRDGAPLSDAERMRRLGRLLRRTSLDELPQLVNVLRGDMSLVGPRPLLMEYLARYTPEQARRHDVRPGLTGLAQVNGRNAMSWNDRIGLDTVYADTWTLGLDLRIIAKTVVMVFRGTGVEAEAGVPMRKFGGSPD